MANGMQRNHTNTRWGGASRIWKGSGECSPSLGSTPIRCSYQRSLDASIPECYHPGPGGRPQRYPRCHHVETSWFVKGNGPQFRSSSSSMITETELERILKQDEVCDGLRHQLTTWTQSSNDRTELQISYQRCAFSRTNVLPPQNRKTNNNPSSRKKFQISDDVLVSSFIHYFGCCHQQSNFVIGLSFPAVRYSINGS